MIKILWAGLRPVRPSAPVVETAAAPRRELPGVQPVLLTIFGRPGHPRGAVEAGADAFRVKDAPVARRPVARLAAAVRTAPEGERGIGPTLAAAALADGANPLTDRERENLRAAGGSTDAGPALSPRLSQGTVRSHPPPSRNRPPATASPPPSRNRPSAPARPHGGGPGGP
ncbi:hypothetical protein GCM10027162_34690 [Streptomyces incanus]